MKIGFLLFPNVTQLDMTGPLQALSRLPDSESLIVAKTIDPVSTDTPLQLVPTHTFDDVDTLDILVVPGGFGVTAALRDAHTMAFIRKMGETATYVTSVCTGALLLGGAGLLNGRKATTHWAYTDLLALCGAKFTPGRVVRDGNVFTGGGVTAGIDFAFALIKDIAGQQTAEAIQLGIEYNPDPPIKSGHPDLAHPKLLEAMTLRYAEPRDASRSALEDALG
ncbi:MAG: DJ-1/PfpI family protein [Pseudomonadota bacterium]